MHKRVCLQAYQLELPPELSRIHNTFHICYLRKCLVEEESVIPHSELTVDEGNRCIEEPDAILVRNTKKLCHKEVTMVKVQWKHHRGANVTWEAEEDMKRRYPHLFVIVLSKFRIEIRSLDRFLCRSDRIFIRYLNNSQDLPRTRKIYQRTRRLRRFRRNFEEFAEYQSVANCSEIKKLIEKLSELSMSALKDQNTKSEFEMKIDLLIKERDSYSSEIKELEYIVSKVVVNEHTTPESKIHTPRNSSVGSNKPTSSSLQKTVSSKRPVCSFDQIRTTNIVYDQNVDGSDDEKNDEKNEEKKGKKEEKKSNKSFVHASKAKKNNVQKGKPDLSYSRDQLIRLSRKRYCSYCRTYDFVHKASDHFWYGSYSITPIRTATNKHGPKYRWVPKSKDDFVLQAPQVMGE
ncbi:hypothetical protein L6452_15657 [Arctium lappa]|uniref:Uncharacterized protein n=1 Tax=Arctium lappa TaxID=4217 RepID=A0ACB9CPH6_ARCLA|nr:hypothetical protein L6452_15657 [Arctium lappa]